MNGGHPDLGELGPELRKLARAILDGLDPAVRAAALLAATNTSDQPGKCQQVWCPVCALFAVGTGEQHPLLTVIADHSVAVMAMIRTLLDADPPGPGSAAPPAGPAGGPTAGGYQRIPVVIEE